MNASTAWGTTGNIVRNEGTFNSPTTSEITCGGDFIQTGGVRSVGLNLIMTGDGSKFTEYLNTNMYRFETSVDITFYFLGIGSAICNLDIKEGGSIHLLAGTGYPLRFPLYAGDYSFSNAGVIDGTGTLMFDIYDEDKTVTFGSVDCAVIIQGNSIAPTHRTLTLGEDTAFGSTLAVLSISATYTMVLSTDNYSLSATHITIGNRGTIDARDATITCSGWNSEAGSFDSGTSTVIFGDTSSVNDCRLAPGQSFCNLSVSDGAYVLFNDTTEVDGFFEAFGLWGGIVEMQDGVQPVSIHTGLNGWLGASSGTVIDGDNNRLAADSAGAGLMFSALAFSGEILGAVVPSSMVVIGDSFVSTALTDQFSDILGISVVNEGVPGQETGPMLARFTEDVVDVSPEWVVIIGGANDIAHSVPVATIKSNLGSMYDLAIAADIRVVTTTILPNTNSFSTEEMQSDQNETNIWIEAQGNDMVTVVDLETLVANSQAVGATNQSLSTMDLHPMYDSGDHIHPNVAGYNRMANYMCSEIFRVDSESVRYVTFVLTTTTFVTFTLSGLDPSGPGCKVYQDGEEIFRQHSGYSSISFSASSGGEFEVKRWDPFAIWDNTAALLFPIALVVGIGAIFMAMLKRGRGRG